jgi:hypothetical protein
MVGSRIVIDLTSLGATGADDEEGGGDDSLQARLADNFLAPRPPPAVDAALKRSYRLPDVSISRTLREQCIRFGEWRSALWSWSREGGSVAATTVGGNVSNLLLFAGYATSGQAPAAHRVRPPSAFDLGAAFESEARLEALVLGYLRWLRQVRRVTHSTTLGYLNSLVVLAQFYFASDGAAGSFGAGERERAVVGGLRRLRSHAHSAAQKERTHKPVHRDWLSWRACQRARRRAARQYLRRRRGGEGAALKAAYARLQRERRARAPPNSKGKKQQLRALCLAVLRHPLYVALQELVCLYLHTIAPPVRVAITRGLEFRTTFVKLRRDPARYVIDLKNNPNSPAARHKTAAHYRHAVMPQPQIEGMTELVDELRSYKLTELNPRRHVFVNRNGAPFSSSTWTGFVKRAWRDFAAVPSAAAAAGGGSGRGGGAGGGSGNSATRRQPPPSLCRTIFVTWLNSVPYNDQDRVFLQGLQQSAADFQTHTLETANRLYDKDTASYERLLGVTQFCEQWSLSTSARRGGADADDWDENLDSDDERFDATTPLPRRARGAKKAAEGPQPAEKKSRENEGPEEEEEKEEEEEEEQHQQDLQHQQEGDSRPPSPGDIVDDGDEGWRDDDDDEDGAIPGAQPKLYIPEGVLDRRTELVRTKTGARARSRWGGTRQRKAVTAWRDQLLVKWAGYSVAEATWEADVAFYQQHYPHLLAAHAAARVPERIAGVHTHPQSGAPHYKLQWRDSSSTTMEPVERVEKARSFRDVLQAFRQQPGNDPPPSTVPTRAVRSLFQRLSLEDTRRQERGTPSRLSTVLDRRY